MINLEFQSIKQMLHDIMKNKLCEVNDESKFLKVVGIYILYIDNFSDDKILPIYIGQTDNIQRRYAEHFKEIMALNRLTKEKYERYQNELFYFGRYKACKIFKYMVDHQCTLNDFHMVLLEKCDVSELDEKEKEYIKKYNSEYFGFNQLEIISNLRKMEYSNLNKIEKDTLMSEVLKNLDNYLDYGFNKFNFILAFGLINRKDDDENNKLIKKIRERIIDEEQITKEVIEDEAFYLKVRQQSYKNAVKKYIIPSIKYNDFPLKNFKIKPQFPKVMINECVVLFIISNTNRWYGETNYDAEIIKIITKQACDQGDTIKEYYINNNSFNQTYYEKDYGSIFTFRNNPFQITTSTEDIHLISLTTEFKTGVNDYELRNNQLWNLNDAVKDIIQNVTDGQHFRLISNQSREVMHDCISMIQYTLGLRLRNEMLATVNLDGLSILIINNDSFKDKYYKYIFSGEGIKTRRVNDFAKGTKTALKGKYDYIVFKVNRTNDMALAAMKSLRKIDPDLQIIAINCAGIKGHRIIENISNVIIFDYNVDTKILLEIFIKYVESKKVVKI